MRECKARRYKSQKNAPIAKLEERPVRSLASKRDLSPISVKKHTFLTSRSG